MALIKHEFPILERDTAQDAIIMPNRGGQYSFPEKCVFAFLEDAVDRFAINNGCEEITFFESITKTIPSIKPFIMARKYVFVRRHAVRQPPFRSLTF